ncbi:hypothetical protein LLS1_19370 [Leifsonia sp. LS1]|nr:hypothetical protein LLS1_19370 [Leifsonia sp. LS1]
MLAAGASVLLVSSLAGCSTLGILSDGGASASRPSETSDGFEAVYAAVASADPRVERASTVETSLSGASRQLAVVIRVTGTEPVSTHTLTAVLAAIRDSAKGDAEMLDLVARDAADPKQILDLSAAIAGLPSDISTLWIDGGLVVSFEDLEKLDAGGSQ